MRAQSNITRRVFLQRAATLGLSASVIALLEGCGVFPAATPAPAKIPQLGFLAAYNPPSVTDPPRESEITFLQSLRELGWVEGQNLIIEWRFAEFKDERLPDLAAELVRHKVDVIVATTTTAALAAKQATLFIPIVVPTMLDPVGSGLVTSLARPGGNVTGLSFLGPDLSGKRLEILKETIPGISRIAILWNAGNLASGNDFRETQAVAQALGIQVRSLGVHNLIEIEDAYRAISSERPDAIVILPENLTGTYAKQIADLAVASKIPSMGGQRSNVTAGGLLSYGPNPIDSYRRTAIYVDKILKGAKPADLPVEQPSKFDFIVNLKTATVLGLTIPQSILAQATEVIQ